MSEVTWIIAERNSASDEQIYVLEVLAENGTLVRQNSEIYELEGAKAVFVLESPVKGYFYSLVEAGAVVNIGSHIGCISETTLDTLPRFPVADEGSGEQLESRQENVSELQKSGAAGPKASKSAELLASKLGVNLAAISVQGFITAEMVQAYFDSQNKNEMFGAGHLSAFSQERIAVIGGSQQATLAWHALLGSDSQRIVGVYDSTSRNDLSDYGVPFLGPTDIHEIVGAYSAGNFDSLFIAIGGGYMDARKLFAEFAAEHEIPLATIIDKRAVIAPTARIGKGSLVMDTARVGPFAVLGRNVFLSAGVNIEHHCEIGEGTTFGPNVALSGRVKIGNYCRIAALVGFEPDAVLGDSCIVASGVIINSFIAPDSVVKTATQLKVRSLIK